MSPFEIQKRSQGVYSRAVTGITGGLMAAFGGYWVYSLLIDLPSVLPGAQVLGIGLTWGLIGAAVAFVVLGGAVVLVTTGTGIGIKKIDLFSRNSVDFLIETEAELRKVSWPNREELTGSTFVVIFVTVMLGIYIVVVDKVVSTVMAKVAFL